jgi:hypothetical protein
MANEVAAERQTAEKAAERAEIEKLTPAYLKVCHDDERIPHCDAWVLHAPGECQYCDGHPEWQKWRTDNRMNFTGHYDQEKDICPAEKRRSVGKINAWGGNKPHGYPPVTVQCRECPRTFQLDGRYVIGKEPPFKGLCVNCQDDDK